MRKFWRVLSVISICLIVGGCSSGQAAADKTTESSEIEDNKTAESTEIAETNTAENAETDLMTYMSSDGFKIKYDPAKAESIEVDEHTVQFKLTGDFSDNNTVTIKYITGKQPEEALYELTEPWGEMDAIERSEGFFPGTSDKWGYWRSFSEKDGDGSVNKTAIAGEYNGGILIFDDEEHMTGDEE
nr:hypothetical protein [Lachnospiraceae bacterium]